MDGFTYRICVSQPEGLTNDLVQLGRNLDMHLNMRWSANDKKMSHSLLFCSHSQSHIEQFLVPYLPGSITLHPKSNLFTSDRRLRYLAREQDRNFVNSVSDGASS